MPHDDHLVQLDRLEEEVRVRLKVHLRARLVHGSLHQRVVRFREHHAGEKIGDDALEQRHVVAQELAQVDVDDRAKHELVLVVLGVPPLQIPRRAKHSHHRAHAVVVVVLRRELLRAQLVALHDLRRAVPRLEVPERVQNDLADHRVVGDHHRHRAEQRFQVIGKLRAPGVAGVHRDGAPRAVLEPDLRALEHERRHLRRDGSLDVQHLLRHHGQNLQVDAVELVEARPRAGRRQTFEELAHLDVVHRVRAVEHDALARERLG